MKRTKSIKAPNNNTNPY